MIINWVRIIFALWAIISLISCTKYEDILISKEMSLFAFVISDNNLDNHTDYIEKDLIKGLKGCPTGTELFLYIDRLNETPTLRHMFLLESGQVCVKTISRYEEQCSTSAIIFGNILKTMIDNSSGKQYGLIYWSHGSGWLPGYSPDTRYTGTKSLGADSIYSMDISDMADVISSMKTPLFTVLDACFMGSVEVAYSLRNSTDYLIACPTETLGIGFPYHLMLPQLVKGTRESLVSSLDIYLEYCYSDYYRDGTISGMASLTDCREMDALASTFLPLAINHTEGMLLDTIQTYDCSSSHLYYDLGQYAKALSDDTAKFSAFECQLKRTVLHKVTTPSVYIQTGRKDSLLYIINFSGLSTYVLGSSPIYDCAYLQTEWNMDCYGTK